MFPDEKGLAAPAVDTACIRGDGLANRSSELGTLFSQVRSVHAYERANKKLPLTYKLELSVKLPRFSPFGSVWRAIWFLSLVDPGYGDLEDILVGDLPNPHETSLVNVVALTSSASLCKTTPCLSKSLARHHDSLAGVAGPHQQGTDQA